MALSAWPHLSDHVEPRAVVFWESASWVGVEADFEGSGGKGREEGGGGDDDDVEEEEGHGVERRWLRKIERDWVLDCCKSQLVQL